MTGKFVWVDLETTGLDARRDYVLEVGLTVTDRDLNILGSWSSLVKNRVNLPVGEGNLAFTPKQDWLDRLEADDYVKTMHDKSGLLDEVRNLPEHYREGGSILTYDPLTVAYMGYKWLTEHMGLEPGQFPMCGSSVHFDRRFLDEHMNALLAFFTYRNIDISTVKELVRVFNPPLRGIMERDPRFDKANAKHRALPDLEASIAELRFYKEWFLVDGDEVDVDALAVTFDSTGPVDTATAKYPTA